MDTFKNRMKAVDSSSKKAQMHTHVGSDPCSWLQIRKPAFEEREIECEEPGVCQEPQGSGSLWLDSGLEAGIKCSLSLSLEPQALCLPC